eukprot:jgi/Picre1/30541/NNA_005904.t1
MDHHHDSFIHRFGQGSLVDQVAITGLERTKLHTVLRELEGLEGINSIDEVYLYLQEAHEALMSLDLFEAVDILIDESAEDDEKVSVRISASELGILGINAGTYVQGSEGTVEAQFNVRNYAGYGEKLCLSVEQGMSRSNAYALRVSIPRIGHLPLLADLKIHQSFENKEKWASYVERLRGVTCSVISTDGTMSLSYDCGWRTLSDPKRMASPDIVKHLGESMKSSITLSFASMHNLNDTCSVNTLTGLELGGVGTHGIYQFLKGNITGKFSYNIADSVELFLEATAGLILPSRSTSEEDICPSDRFYMGGLGPFGLRGFHQNGLGPMCPRRRNCSPKGGRQRDALGGSCALGVVAALRFQLPYATLAALGMKGQIFANAGTVGNLWGDESIFGGKNPIHTFRTKIRATVGAGIVWPLKIGQLELNICRVMSQSPSDYSKNGIQFGITPY